MKKVILTMCVAGALLATSCKKTTEAATKAVDATTNAATKAVDATTDAATKAVDATTGAATKALGTMEGVTIPEFKDPKVGEYLKSYSQYAKDYIAANGNVAAITKLAPKGAELASKMKQIAGSLDTESAMKFSKVMTAIQSKMAPAK